MSAKEENSEKKYNIDLTNNNMNISTKTGEINNDNNDKKSIEERNIKKENIERNKIILDLLQKNKIDQDEQNNTLDQKCSSMINILILIITIQCGIFVNVELFKSLGTSDLVILIKVLLILTLIGNFISLFLFVNAYSLKDFKGLTREDELIKYGEQEEDIELIYQEVCVDYKKTIEENKQELNRKIHDIKLGFNIITFTTGLFVLDMIICLELIV